jgi:hypothetical protein
MSGKQIDGEIKRSQGKANTQQHQRRFGEKAFNHSSTSERIQIRAFHRLAHDPACSAGGMDGGTEAMAKEVMTRDWTLFCRRKNYRHNHIREIALVQEIAGALRALCDLD